MTLVLSRLDAGNPSLSGVIDSMPGPGLKEKYRLLISAMTPSERACREQEVSHIVADKKRPLISNERFLRKTIPMGFTLSGGESVQGQSVGE